MKKSTLASLYCLAALLTGSLPCSAVVAIKMLPMAKKGDFIEIDENVFVRPSSIRKITGCIYFYLESKNKDNIRDLSLTVPLSLEGIKKIKALDLAGMIKQATHSDAKLEDFTYNMFIDLNIDDVKLCPFNADSEEIPKSWDEVEKTLKTVVEAYDRLFALASTGKPDAVKHAE